jgi:hypothetical protein
MAFTLQQKKLYDKKRWHKYYLEHKEEIRAKNDKWAKDNHEKYSKIVKLQYWKHRTKKLKYLKKWRQEHHDYMKNYYRKLKNY